MLRSFKLIIFSLFASFSVACFADTATWLLNEKNDPVAGNKKGNITIVEFFDYQCSHCSNMTPVLQKIIKQNPNVRVVYKEYPIRGMISEYAARAALAAH